MVWKCLKVTNKSPSVERYVRCIYRGNATVFMIAHPVKSVKFHQFITIARVLRLFVNVVYSPADLLCQQSGSAGEYKMLTYRIPSAIIMSEDQNLANSTGKMWWKQLWLNSNNIVDLSSILIHSDSIVTDKIFARTSIHVTGLRILNTSELTAWTYLYSLHWLYLEYKCILHRKYFGYLHEFIIFEVTICSAIKPTKCYLSSTIIFTVSFDANGMNSSANVYSQKYASPE